MHEWLIVFVYVGDFAHACLSAHNRARTHITRDKERRGRGAGERGGEREGEQ